MEKSRNSGSHRLAIGAFVAAAGFFAQRSWPGSHGMPALAVRASIVETADAGQPRSAEPVPEEQVKAIAASARTAFVKAEGGSTEGDWGFTTTPKPEDCSVSECYEDGPCISYRFRERVMIYERSAETRSFDAMDARQLAYVNALKETLPENCR
jgi:hypothetical protein